MNNPIALSRSAVGFRMRASVVLIFVLSAAAAGAETYSVDMPSGANYDRAAFRLWLPDDIERVRAVVVLVPGSNGDGRDEVASPIWQKLAIEQRLGLVGVQLTDKEHENMFIEHYVEVSRGSGQTLLDALSRLGDSSEHPEIGSAPLLMWGMSAGGEFNYEMALWKPERVLGFVVNKGGIYYSAQAGSRAREVPGLFFSGKKDLAFRNDIIRGIYSINRRSGALWGLVEEPEVAHEVARSRDMAIMFYEALLELRLPEDRELRLDDGFICDPVSVTCGVAGDAPERTYPTAWLPSRRLRTRGSRSPRVLRSSHVSRKSRWRQPSRHARTKR